MDVHHIFPIIENFLEREKKSVTVSVTGFDSTE
jgi:hypothetical protein